MSNLLDQRMAEAWELVRSRLFCEKTNLIYDSLSSAEPAERFAHLPEVEEIERQLPNPCGWGTGMEDSMLNAGSVIDVLDLRARESGATADLAEFAGRMFAGMATCATVHGRPGFVARSLSPRDGRSCYLNSSRDQFTLFVYGVWRFYNSALADAAQKRQAAELLESVARYCEASVTTQSGYNLCRLDGHPAMVSEMVGVDTHEILRLPMFYAAAWTVTQNPHWRELCLKYARPGIEENLRIDRKRYWWNIALVQMQVSLALLAEVEPEPELQAKYRAALRIGAEMAAAHFPAEADKLATYAGPWDAPAVAWSALPLRLRAEIRNRFGSHLHGGYPFLMPQLTREFNEPFELIRAVGNLTIAMLLCREYQPEPAILAQFDQLAARPDYTRHTSGGAVNILHAYWLKRSRRK